MPPGPGSSTDQRLGKLGGENGGREPARAGQEDRAHGRGHLLRWSSARSRCRELTCHFELAFAVPAMSNPTLVARRVLTELAFLHDMLPAPPRGPSHAGRLC